MTLGTALSIPHGVGYVWASTGLREVCWNLVDEHGFNQDIYRQLGHGRGRRRPCRFGH